METKKAVIIMYYPWSSDGRGKTSGDIYKKLGYELLVFNVQDKDFPKFRNEESSRVWCGIKKYMGDKLLFYLLYHLIFMFQSFFWLIARGIIDRPKILHIHNMPDYVMIVALAGKIFGMKVIWDIRDITPVAWLTKKKSDKLASNDRSYNIILGIQNFFSKFASAILCADHFQKDFLVKNGIPENKIHVFLNLPLENKYNWIGPSKTKDPFVLVYHGTITHRLGLDIALLALSKINSDINIKFKILGEGDQVNDLIKLTRELNIKDKIEIQNQMIPNEKIPEWVKGANGAIIPNRKTLSTDNFMLPHKMLEYVKLGIPVIAPRLKIIQYYFDETQAIFFEPENAVDLSNAILKLYNSDTEEQAQKAYNFYKTNRYQNNFDVIENLIEQ